MQIPGLGTVTKDKKFGWYSSQPTPVPVLGGKKCRIIVEGYDKDRAKEDFHVAIANFLAIGKPVLDEAAKHVFAYYKACWQHHEGDDIVTIKSPREVWKYVKFGSEPMVSRRAYGDKGIYLSLECGCDWEEEHGLQIVFKNGLKINKVGPYDGHLTNSDAYADENLEDVVYHAIS